MGIALLNLLFALVGILMTHLVVREGSTEYVLPSPWFQILYVTYTTLSLFILSAIPWQWTGDARARATFGRGLLQTCLAVGLESLLTTVPYTGMMVTSAQPPFGITTIVVIHIAQWSFVGFAVAAWEHRMALKAAALNKAREAQWTLLQSQMSPHALLNALNGLAQLVREDEAAGRQGIQNLSEIYRHLMEHGNAQWASLGQEQDLLSRFLAVEKLRLGTRLILQWEWDTTLNGVQLPPLLLQPLVENAIKHGVAASETGGTVRIRAAREGRDLVLEVANTGAALGPSPTPGPGLGLRNLEARLHLAFGDRGRFRLYQDGEWTVARIHLLGGKA